MVLPFGTYLVFHNVCFMFWNARNVWGYLVVMISDLCTLVKLSLGSRIKASAKCINVNVIRRGDPPRRPSSVDSRR